MNNVGFEDESGDKKYFTMLPNYVLNHSTVIDQGVYVQMKRYAGEKGECYTSKATLMKKLGIGNKALNKSIKYLLSRGWIYKKGFKMARTKGGMQKIQVFGVKDIWKENIMFYDSQGYAESTPLDAKGIPKGDKGYPESATKKNMLKKKEISDEIEQTADHKERTKALKDEIRRAINKW